MKIEAIKCYKTFGGWRADVLKEYPEKSLYYVQHYTPHKIAHWHSADGRSVDGAAAFDIVSEWAGDFEGRTERHATVEKPDPLRQHEALHSASICTDLFSDRVRNTVYVESKPEIIVLCDAALEAMMQVYQAIGQEDMK